MSRRGAGARVACGLLLTGAGLLGAGAAVSAAAVSPEIAAARLQGNYAVAGVVSQAVGIAGERRGQHVLRTWNFISPCATGACPLLGLHRQRAGGIDPLFLRQIAPGTYAGAGIFTAALRCRGRLFAQGSVVPYTITLTITTAAPQPDGSMLATGFSAAYRNRGRVGQTRCYSPPSYDSARYLGVPVPPGPQPLIRRVRRMPSSKGSWRRRWDPSPATTT